jgi:hypothetical protein
MFQDVRNAIGRLGAIATAALALTGCSRSNPETNTKAHSLTNVTLPTAPLIAPDQRIIALLKDPKLPVQVVNALKNPEVQATLHRIATNTENPESYVRNAPYASTECVVVLQHLLNVGRGAAITNALNYAEGIKQRARAIARSDPGRSEELFKTANGIRRYAERAPSLLKPDGRYGPDSHNLRGFLTQVENIVSGLTFPHKKVDVGANDTAIGPMTLNLLFRYDRGVGYLLLADPATYKVSVDALTNSSLATTNSVRRVTKSK